MTKPIKANRGEWSELYVALKLLADGQLFSADNELEKIATIYYPIVKIIRDEISSGKQLEYILNGNVRVVDSENSELLIEVSTNEFVRAAKKLFAAIRAAKGSSFEVPEIQQFLEKIFITTHKAKSKNKSDIILVIHDLRTATTPTVSFSIKSLAGKDSTLLNPSPGTNFIYQIINPGKKTLDLKSFNKSTLSLNKSDSRISNRLNKLIELGYDIKFQKVQSETFQLNLELIDTDLPKILSHMLLYKYIHRKAKISDLLHLLNTMNPLDYNLAKGHPFYSYKINGLLYDYALGMTPEKIWTGNYSTTGGIILVKEDGELLCYHVYEKNRFQEYLVNYTKLDQASTGEDAANPGQIDLSAKKKYYYGWVYEENGNLLIKINLQIRFIKKKKSKK